ncbi:hypothetical protein GLOTRDRAFT_133964 [Gloeophyllum trabeum ATCC 11539]|uniref:Uncharacterized protein n=1 Tax=Gloeophyllum trabeum (strain ATCC 11539 / FP-39264 / Madison 617) TaxID=670483 RepID=S7PRC4_GLOTA|nr:uncharacterized protein GLOTRDRAFT_133964 [Gloeophyllum trabeum ATCC 11539]EPQ50411.1 hypothetical protein GLOTRDRAFT_133964 [Gloeophyllum trabeum ATCC 11539]
MTEKLSKTQAFLKEPLTELTPPPGEENLHPPIPYDAENTTSIWADEVLKDYCLEEQPVNWRKHPLWNTFWAAAGKIDQEPHTSYVSAMFIYNEEATVDAVKSQCISPVWELMQPMSKPNKTVYQEFALQLASQGTADTQTTPIVQRLYNAAKWRFSVFHQVQPEVWKGKNDKDAAGGVRADIVMGPVLISKPKDFQSGPVTRAALRKLEIPVKALIDNAPYTTQNIIYDTSREDKSDWVAIQRALLPIECKKLAMIDNYTLKEIASRGIPLGGSISITTGKPDNTKAVRYLIQQPLRYAVHYDSGRSCLSDYNQWIVFRLPEKMAEDCKRYEEKKKQVATAATTDIQIDVPATTGGKESKQKKHQPTDAVARVETPPKESRIQKKRLVEWMSATRDEALQLVTFIYWLQTQDCAGGVERDNAEREKPRQQAKGGTVAKSGQK